MARHRKYNYDHLLSTNAIPMPTEVVSLKHGIESLEKRVASLKSQLQELEEDLHQHRAALSPVRQMPVEVLGEIFSHAFSPSCALDVHGRSRLVNLSLVCRGWRDATLCSRRLWSRVVLLPDDLSSEKVVTWLDRSGSIPKTLEISLFSVDHRGQSCAEVGSNCKSNSVALAKLLTDGPPLDHLSLKMRETQCLRNLVDALHFYNILSKPKARPWDSIRSFTLTVENEWAPNELEDADESVLLHLPTSIAAFCLQLPPYLYMDFSPFSPISSFIPPSLLHRLTSLSLSWDWDDEYIYNVLCACHSEPIETLTLEVKSDSAFEDPDSAEFHRLSQIRLPQLRSLNLQIFPHSANVLRIFQSPSLVSLSIHFKDSWPGWAEDGKFSFNVLSFVNNSRCQATFRSLSIRDCVFEAEDLAGLLLSLSFLTHLKLDNVQFYDGSDMFACLRSSKPRILPLLEILELQQLPWEYDFSLVESFLESRWPSRRTPVPSPTGLFMDEYTFEGSPDSLKQVLVTYRNVQGVIWSSLKTRADEDTPFINALRHQCGVVVSVSDHAE